MPERTGGQNVRLAPWQPKAAGGSVLRSDGLQGEQKKQQVIYSFS